MESNANSPLESGLIETNKNLNKRTTFLGIPLAYIVGLGLLGLVIILFPLTWQLFILSMINLFIVIFLALFLRHKFVRNIYWDREFFCNKTTRVFYNLSLKDGVFIFINTPCSYKIERKND